MHLLPPRARSRHVSSAPRHRLVLGCLSLLVFAGCAGPRAPTLDRQALAQFEARGYPMRHDEAAAETPDVRLVDGRPTQLLWRLPQDAGRHPLVIVLPGAGQDLHALAHHREALATAGYAVLSWQPLAEDAHRRTHAYEVPLLQRRRSQLADLLDVLRTAQTTGQGDPLLAQVDLNQLALMGYDIGAWTTQYAAGEHVAANDTPAPLPAIRAYIAISPFASFAQGGFDTRYRDIHAPVLAITSDRDTDPAAGVGDASLRTALFGGMPAGDKYLLMWQGPRHAALGEGHLAGPDDGHGPRTTGKGPKDSATGGPPDEGMDGDADGDASPGDGSAGEGPGGSGPPGGAGGGPGGGPGGAGGGGRRGGGGGPGGQTASSPSPTQTAMQASAQTTMVVAFLDAYVAQDALARQWLHERAAHWLSPVGDWLQK